MAKSNNKILPSSKHQCDVGLTFPGLTGTAGTPSDAGHLYKPNESITKTPQTGDPVLPSVTLEDVVPKQDSIPVSHRAELDLQSG